MLSPEDKATIAAQKKALRDWLDGDREKPFVLPKCEGWCVCSAVFLDIPETIRMNWRFIVVGLINIVPLSSVKILLLRLLGARIGNNVFISPRVFIDPMYPNLIELEDDVLLGIGARIITHEYSVKEFRIGRVRIGRDAVVGGFSTIRCGVSIGRGAMVGMNSFVNRDVADGDTVGGVPAKSLESSKI